MSEVLTPTEPVEIDLGDGKVRHLRYSLGSMRRLKKQFGKTLMAAETLMSLDEDRLADLIHEGLVEKDGLSVDDMADMIDSRRIKDLVEAFSLAFAGSFPAKNEPSQPDATIQ
jgi:hypothetical protein